MTMCPVRHRNRRLYAAILGHLEAVERGDPVDAEELTAEYPDFAPDLREFFAAYALIDRITAPVRDLARVARRAAEAKRAIRTTAPPSAVRDPALGLDGQQWSCRAGQTCGGD